MSKAVHPGPPTTTPDHWWVTAIIAAGLTAIVVTMVHLWPMALWTWAIGSAIAVFAIVMYFNPRHWLKRRSGACLGIAGAGAALPAVAGALNVPQGWIEFSTDASPWIAGIFGVLSLGFAWLDRKPNVKQLDEPIRDIKQGVSQIQVEQLSQTELLQKMAAEMQGLRGASEDEIEKKLRPLIEQELQGQHEQQLADKDRTIKSLIDGLVTASRKGDALEQVRKSGDGRTIVAALREISISDEESLIQRHREIAGWAFLVGEIDQAEQSLQMILRLRPDDVDAVNRRGHIHQLRGRLDEAEGSYRRVLELAGDDGTARAAAYGNLGLVMQTRGDLDGAEAMYRKSLDINENLAHLGGMASTYGNLGSVMRTRGNLDGAEAMYHKALVINEKLGRLVGIANQYSNLGLVAETRGDLGGAEVMHRKALEINGKLGRLEGMAANYGNLGLVMQTRGDLDEAEAMYRKSLEIEKKLGRLAGVANAHGNLGNVMLDRGDLDGAEAMYGEALEIDEKLGRLEGMATAYGNLGFVMQTRGDLDGAEAMQRKSLEIEEKLGRREGMAKSYGNLGAVMEMRGDLDAALALWTKSRDLFTKLGAQHRADQAQGWIDELPK